jgi:hypothetical protein
MTRVMCSGRLVESGTSRYRGITVVQPQIYEITFTGQAGPALSAEFDDCEVLIGAGTTTMRAEVPDQAALDGLLARLSSLRLHVVHLHLVASGPQDRGLRT